MSSPQPKFVYRSLGPIYSRDNHGRDEVHHEDGAEASWEDATRNGNGITSTPEITSNDADEATGEAAHHPELDKLDDIPLSSLAANRGECNGNFIMEGEEDEHVMVITVMEVDTVDPVQYMTNARSIVEERRAAEQATVAGDRTRTVNDNGETATNVSRLSLPFSSGRVNRNRQRNAANQSSQTSVRATLCEDEMIESSAAKNKVRPRQIMDVMRISGRDKGIVGIRKIRDNTLEELDLKQRNHLIRIIKNIYARTAYSFLPRDGRHLFHVAVNAYGYESPLKSKLTKALQVCAVHTREKRVVRAVIAGTVGGKEAKHMLAMDQCYSFGEEEDDVVDDEGVTDGLDSNVDATRTTDTGTEDSEGSDG